MNTLIICATAVTLLLAPLLLGLVGVVKSRRSPRAPASHWTWRWSLRSSLLYVLAFNLTFFIQELFLVLPKALTPGLRPTLFHNNHSWQGDNPLAALFQGTGALAILLSAVICLARLKRRGDGRESWRLLWIWMAYCGFFMALPQVVVGALSAQSDVGMAMGYLQLTAGTKTLAALLALAAMPCAAWRLKHHLLALAPQAAHIETARARTIYLFHIATVPLVLALPVILVFRVPREWIEVVIVPAVVTVAGLIWLQATAWCPTRTRWSGGDAAGPLVWPLALVLFLLMLFQLVLRPGIRFY